MRLRICRAIAIISLGLTACDRSQPVGIDPQLAASDRSVILTPSNDTIDVGGTVQFSAQLIQNGRPRKAAFTWSSSDTSVATVSATGLVTGIGSGEAFITATASRTQSGTANVIVRSNPPRVVAHLPLAGSPTGSVVSSLNPKTGALLDILNVGGTPREMSYDAATRSILVPNEAGWVDILR